MTTTKNSTSIKRMVIAALMLALAYILPNFTGNIPQIGNMLLPMHLPTILCGYLVRRPLGRSGGLYRALDALRYPRYAAAVPHRHLHGR